MERRLPEYWAVYIVYFHNVLREPLDEFDQETPRQTVAQFEQELEWLRRRFKIIGFDECLELIRKGQSDGDLVALSFDDGHLGIYRHAMPLLTALDIRPGVFLLSDSGIPAPHFPLLHFEALEVAFRLSKAVELARFGIKMPTFEDRARVFQGARQRLKLFPGKVRQERQATLLEDLGVSENAIEARACDDERFWKLGPVEIAALEEAGWVMGGHTRSHPVLARLQDSDVRAEIELPASLRSTSGMTPFAYPYGGSEHCDSRVAKLVQQAGYGCAFTTHEAAVQETEGLGRFLLPRVSFRQLHQRRT